MKPATDTTNASSALQAHPASFTPAYWQALPEGHLVEGCRRGDPGAFDVLRHRYEGSVYRLAYRLAGNHDDASEIASETFLRIYRGMGTLECAVTLPAWINRIVTNVHHDRWRRADRRPAASLDVLPEAAREAALSADRNGSDPPYEHLETAERRQILDDAIASLPAHYRTLVTLFHHKQRTYDEIAHAMRIPVGTVKSRLHRARLALREILAPERSLMMD